MSGVARALPIVVAAAAGGLGAVAARDALAASPVVARWVAAALEPLRRAGAEGYRPTVAERRRLAGLGAGALLLVALGLFGPAPAVPLAAAGPAVAAWVVGLRRRRYRRAVERGLADTATAIADALAAGRSVRAALVAAAGSLEGPPAVEMSRVGADLELGASTNAALDGLRERLRSPRVDALCAALAAQGLAGGDLVGLLRRFATAAAEREGVVAEARSATAQARFTGLLVAAMPLGAAALGELASPGFLAGILGNAVSLLIVGVAAVLQAAGFTAIRRLGRVDESAS